MILYKDLHIVIALAFLSLPSAFLYHFNQVSILISPPENHTNLFHSTPYISPGIIHKRLHTHTHAHTYTHTYIHMHTCTHTAHTYMVNFWDLDFGSVICCMILEKFSNLMVTQFTYLESEVNKAIVKIRCIIPYLCLAWYSVYREQHLSEYSNDITLLKCMWAYLHSLLHLIFLVWLLPCDSHCKSSSVPSVCLHIIKWRGCIINYWAALLAMDIHFISSIQCHEWCYGRHLDIFSLY
jgi:hypothetical protein